MRGILREKELGRWYTDVILKSGLADYGTSRGNIVIKPYGYSVWKNIIDKLNRKLKQKGHQEAYFPLLLPEDLIMGEKEYIEGLDPKVLTITKGGGEKLGSNLVVRPSSETIISYMFSKWIKSYRDLPQKVYQSCNIARWEERTRPFIKGMEILWLEGHTAHVSHFDAIHELAVVKEIFNEMINDILLIPIIWGQETKFRKFAGSITTYTAEGIMPNGQALQLAAIYDLGQIFSKAFNIEFRTSKNEIENSWTTNWGLGFRLIGALTLVHGDERGLRLPVDIAPIQLVIIPVHTNCKKSNELIEEYVDNVDKKIYNNSYRVHIDYRIEKSLGSRINEWEEKGVPLIIVIGRDEQEKRTVKVLRRDKPIGGNANVAPYENLSECIKSSLNMYNNNIKEQALQFRDKHTSFLEEYDSIEKCVETGFGVAQICSKDTCEGIITKQFGKIVKCVYSNPPEYNYSNRCIVCGSETERVILLAKSY